MPLPPDRERTRHSSVLERLSDRSSSLGLRYLFKEADRIRGGTWLPVDEAELRCEAGGRSEGSLCRLPEETVEKWEGSAGVQVGHASFSGFWPRDQICP